MAFDRDKHHRQSYRLRNFDYARPGAYFITICVWHRHCWFGDIVDGALTLNTWGDVVDRVWQGLPHYFPRVDLDAHVVMPNHFHGIVIIRDIDHRDGQNIPGRDDVFPQYSQDDCDVFCRNASPLRPNGTKPNSIGAIVQNFKSVSTRRINAIRNAPGTPVWQRNYYDRVIRDEKALTQIRAYIQNNPQKWVDDRLHPHGPSKG